MEATMAEDIYKNKKLCKRCHRELKDEKSKELGFGPVCYKKYINRQRHFLFKMEELNEIIK